MGWYQSPLPLASRVAAGCQLIYHPGTYQPTLYTSLPEQSCAFMLAWTEQVRDMREGVDVWIAKPSVTNQALGICVFDRVAQLEQAVRCVDIFFARAFGIGCPAALVARYTAQPVRSRFCASSSSQLVCDKPRTGARLGPDHDGQSCMCYMPLSLKGLMHFAGRTRTCGNGCSSDTSPARCWCPAASFTCERTCCVWAA